MRDGWKSRWGWRATAVVLMGGLLVLGTGTVVTQAGERDDDHKLRNPFERILDKLDKILDAIKGEGGQDGNHTLRWDTNHPSASRFTTAFPGAVLDKNTGLGAGARYHGQKLALGTSICPNKNVGGTVGWRLPSVVELKSVQDPTLPPPFVPASVFTGIQSAVYWSASTVAFSPSEAWAVDFGPSIVSPYEQVLSLLRYWCVRGPMQESVY
jgi:hypothetical protein